MKFTTIKHLLTLTITLSLTVGFLTIDLSKASAAGGAFDNTFDGNGRLATDFSGGEDRAFGVLIQPDGKIVAVGSTDSDSSPGMCALSRYNPNGSLDTTFGGDGRVTISLAGFGGCVLSAVVIQPDGKIVAAGLIFNAGGFYNQMAVVRVLSNGDPDTSFSGDGAITGVGFLGESEANALAIQPNGSITIVGFRFSGANSDMAVSRLTSAGVLDTTFSSDGVTTIDFGGNGDRAEGVHILANGKILIGGTANPGSSNFALARMNPNGSLDATFDLDGKVTTDIPGSGDEKVYDMKVQSDGKIILAGGDGNDSVMVRYNADATLDTSFGFGGLVRTNVNPLFDRAIEIALQTDGKIVLVCLGSDEPQLSTDFNILRYNKNGSLDASFGVNGLLRSDMTNGSNDKSNAVAIQTDGKIVVAGSTRNTSAGATTNFCVARYLPGNKTKFDFDGDGKTDIAIFRPAPTGGEWWWQRSSDNQVPATPFGLATDVIAPGDFTGDGKLDITVWRPDSGFWYSLRSEDFSFYGFPFGASGDVPMTADYDGDGRADPTVFRAAVGQWYITRSSDGQVQTVQFGLPGDVPVVSDYDGDGSADVAIRRNGPNGAEWWINRSTQGVIALIFGASTDRAVPGDYTGDGKADVAYFRPSTGFWFILRSEDFSFYGFPFGSNGDVPSPGDYDGDGRIDPTVFRPSVGQWFVNRSSSGQVQTVQFGVPSDRPIPNSFVR